MKLGNCLILFAAIGAMASPTEANIFLDLLEYVMEFGNSILIKCK